MSELHYRPAMPVIQTSIDRSLSIGNVRVLARIYASVPSYEEVKSTEIAETVGTKRRFNEQFLQLLSLGGIVQGKQGPKGGHRRIRECSSVLEIVEAIYGERDDPLIKAWANVRPEDV